MSVVTLLAPGWSYMCVVTMLAAGWYIVGCYWPNTVIVPALD